MNFHSFFKSKKFCYLTWSFACMIILLLTFKVGMIVGYKKASFSYRWGENYHHNFGGPYKGFMAGFSDKDFIESHGTFGQIIKIDGATLVVKSRNNTEKIIVIKDDTVIRNGTANVALSDLKIDDYIVTIGTPNDQGQIEAKLIRIMPSIPVPDK